MDLGNVKAELKFREDKIKELHSDRMKLKTLLKKAKTVIDMNTAKYKAAVEQQKQTDAKLKEVNERNKDLMHTLEIFQAKRNGMAKDKVKTFLARIKVADVGYTLL